MKKYSRKYNTPEYRKKYTGIYGSWYAMKQRCGNPNHKAYKNYGERGISYDPNWESFTNFKKDMYLGYQRGLTLERIDNNKGYFKKNCKWANRKAQANNKRTNIVLSFQGKTLPLAIWAEHLNLNFGTLRSRFYRGMSVEEILKPNLYRPSKLLT